MASFNSGEVCELVGLFILKYHGNRYQTNNFGLYRDNRLAVFKNTSRPQAERIRKEITRQCKEHELKITIQVNLKSVDYLEVTFN